MVSLSANAASVLLDLDGDGRISYSTIDADINVDGLVDKAHWVAGHDGILFRDKFGDGQLHRMDQYAFAQPGGGRDQTRPQPGYTGQRRLDAGGGRLAGLSARRRSGCPGRRGRAPEGGSGHLMGLSHRGWGGVGFGTFPVSATLEVLADPG